MDPAAAVDSVEVDRQTGVVELTQRHAAVTGRTVTDQVAADHARAWVSEPVDWQTFSQDTTMIHVYV